MKKLLVATKNPGKVAELTAFLKSLPVEIVSLKDLGMVEEVVEDGKTYEENSKKKAFFYAQKSGLLTVADDAGIEIDALGGAPGIHSRRWLGHEATDTELVDHMKKISKELPQDNRKALYKVVLTIASPEGEYYQAEGVVEGVIAKEMNGEVRDGYPYDSFFYLPEIKKYYHVSSLTHEENEQYNHRYIAVKRLIPMIKKLL